MYTFAIIIIFISYKFLRLIKKEVKRAILMIEKDFLPTNAATSGNGSKLVTAESRIRLLNSLKSVRADQRAGGGLFR